MEVERISPETGHELDFFQQVAAICFFVKSWRGEGPVSPLTDKHPTTKWLKI